MGESLESSSPRPRPVENEKACVSQDSEASPSAGCPWLRESRFSTRTSLTMISARCLKLGPSVEMIRENMGLDWCQCHWQYHGWVVQVYAGGEEWTASFLIFCWPCTFKTNSPIIAGLWLQGLWWRVVKPCPHWVWSPVDEGLLIENGSHSYSAMGPQGLKTLHKGRWEGRRRLVLGK